MKTWCLKLLLALPIGGLAAAAQAGSDVSLGISFTHSFHGEPLVLDSLRYQNAAGETLSVTRLSYLLSGFALEQTNHTWVELPDQYAWIDAARRRTVLRLDHVPAGLYRGLRFRLGPDPAANAADLAAFPAGHPLNPNLNGLHWSWQGGYIFLALEGLYQPACDGRASSRGDSSISPMPEARPQEGGGGLAGYSYHLARDPNRTRVTLAVDLDLARDAAAQIDFDLAALLGSPRPLSFETNGAATHSRDGDPVSASLAANLPGSFHARQVVFTVPVVTKAPPAADPDLPAHFTPYRFNVSAAFPIPELPRDNPLIEERVALGQQLFNQSALSRDGWITCASCHFPSAAFSDPRQFSVGVGSRSGARHSMPLFNLAWKDHFFWDGRAPSLRAQVMGPISDHNEMDESPANVAAKLAAMSEYPKLFQAAFGSPEITPAKIGLALEQFLLTLTSSDSKFDRALRGAETLSPGERRGFELFMTENDPRTGQHGADCFHCHGGPLFTDHQFHNNGLDPQPFDARRFGTLGAEGRASSPGAALPPRDPGRFNVTTNAADYAKFATPSLRNVELTAPYMHDGRFSTLEEVVEHYSSGLQRGPTLDPNLARHPGGLHLSREDQQALVAFLKTLTDPSFRSGPAASPQAGSSL